MNQSEDIKELVAALSKAQGVMKPAVFNKTNPHFKNRYADFTAIMDACRQPLAENGLSIMQYCQTKEEKLYLVTMLAHVSGQWIKSDFPLNPKNMDSQSIGSSMTYGKRYSLSGMLGIVSDDEDDDGEASHGRQATQVQSAKANVVAPVVPEKLNANQVAILKKLESKLDPDYKVRMLNWVKSSFKVEKMEDIPTQKFQLAFETYEKAIKMNEQEIMEKNRELVSIS